MHWLSLDLSSPHATIALHRVQGDTPTLVRECALGDSYQHTERLLPVLKQLLRDNGLGVDAIARFLTVSGPGSFTGLRIAMASLKAFAMVTKAPVDVVSGSEIRALAWAAENRAAIGTCLSVLTFVSAGRFVVSRFEVAADGVVAHSESVETALASPDPILLGDDRVTVSAQLQPFPLRARQLAEHLSRARSRKTAATLAEWIALTPAYFGASHYE